MVEGELLLPRIQRVCNREDVRSGCDEREWAEETGKFYPDYEAWGWVHADTPLRYMSDRVFHETYISRHDYKHINYSGRPYTYAECPWCFQSLPSMGLVRKERDGIAQTGEE